MSSVALVLAASDYFAFSQEVVFSAGITEMRVAIFIMEDSVLESMEFFYVRVTVPASYAGAVFLDTDAATINITDNDSRWLHLWLLFEVACNQ